MSKLQEKAESVTNSNIDLELETEIQDDIADVEAESNIDEQITDALEINEDDAPDMDEAVEIVRPLLTLEQAAVLLGKSLRALERSIIGKWGNKLPDGWSARKVGTENGSEWRVIPPPGFRIKRVNGRIEHVEEEENSLLDDIVQATKAMTGLEQGKPAKAQAKKKMFLPQSIDQPAIVIDRTDEVESLLRELVSTQKSLSEERRHRMEDLRLINQMQSSMRLLETNAQETKKIKVELEEAWTELKLVQTKYKQIAAMPWWKRIFYKF